MTLTARIVAAPRNVIVPTVAPTVSSLAGLRLLTGGVTVPIAVLTSATVEQGVFAWNAVSATDNGATRINPGGEGSSGPGWDRIDPFPLNVKHAGAKGDGVTNDTVAIARALAVLKARNGGELFFPAGVYLCDADAINLQGPSGGGWANIKLRGETRRSATNGGSILKARTAGEYLIRCAGQNIVAEDMAFDGAKLTTNVVFFDYQSFASGLARCFVTGAQEDNAIAVTPDHTSDVFNATGHGLQNGDQVYFTTSGGSIPGELYQPVLGVNKTTNNWVWFVRDRTADTFKVESAAGAGVYAFSDNGTSVSVHKVGGNLVRIGGVSGLQADTGFLRDCVLYQDITDATRLAGRGIFISDNNAVLWDICKTHIQSCVDCIWIKGGGASFRECTIFPYPSVSRSHVVKEGSTNQVVFTDGTATEVDAVPFLVILGSQSTDYAQAWTIENMLFNSAASSINWDCRQPLVLSGTLGGDIYFTTNGAYPITAIAPSFPLSSFNDPTFHGEVTRLIRIGSQDRTGRIRNEMRRLEGPASPSEYNDHGFGLFLAGGQPYDRTVRKAGPVVADLGEATTDNQTNSVIFGYREDTTRTVTDVDTGTNEFEIVGHGFTLYDSVQFQTDDTLPGGLQLHEDYWVVPNGSDLFTVSRARDGVTIDITSAGAGSLTCRVLKAFSLVMLDVSNVANFANATLWESLVVPMKIRSSGQPIGLEGSLCELIANAGAGPIWLQGEWRGNFDNTRKTAWALAANANQAVYEVNYNPDDGKYVRTGGAGQNYIDTTTGATAGDQVWKTAPSGTAGNAITFTERLRLEQAGVLKLTGAGGTAGWGTSTGSPEGAISATPGSLCSDTSNGELYIKNTGTGNTGWKLVTHA